jgi:gliding motility-associated-like protein
MCRYVNYINTHSKFVYLLLILLLSGSYSLIAQLKADFTADKTGGCSPLVVSFTNRTTGASANATYAWDFSNGNSSIVQNPGAVFKEEKAYTVTLTVRDGNVTSSKTLQVTVYNKPVADFTLSTVKDCFPAAVTFTSTSTTPAGNISSYYWDFGDGSTQQGYSAGQLHTYNADQTATVSLTVTNNLGCNATVQKKDIIQILPHLSATFTSDKKVLCLETDPVQFTNTSTGPGTLSYLWDFGDGNTSTQKAPSYSFNKKGIYSVKLTVKNSHGCTATNTQTDLLNVASYSSDFTIPSLICKGSYLTYNSQSAPFFTYNLWEVDGNTAAYNSNYLSYGFNTPGTHTVKLTNTFDNCIQSVTKQVTVKDIPNLNGFVSEFTGLCGAPVTVNFKDTTSTAVTWEWDFNYNYYNPVITSRAKAASFNYTYDAMFGIYLKVTNAEGCSSIAIKQIQTIKPYVTLNYTHATAPGGTLTSCGPNTITFASNSSEEIVTYNWNFGDGGTSTDAKPVHEFTSAGNYQVTLNYITKNGCTGTAYFNGISVRKMPILTINSSLTEVCGNSQVIFSASPGQQDIFWWTWDFGDGTGSIPGNAAIGHSYEKAGTYTVKLYVNNGCDTTFIKENVIKVLPPFPKIIGTNNTCDGTRGEVIFTQASTDATSITWDFGDGTTPVTTAGDQAQIKHTYSKTGSFIVTLTAVNNGCSLKANINASTLLKQKPVLTATKTSICVDEALVIKVAGYEKNPRANDNYTNHFYTYIQYGDNSQFNGYNSPFSYYWSNVYDANVGFLDRDKDKIRVITTSTSFACTDTTNYIPYKINGAIAGFKVTADDVCFNDMAVLTDTSRSLNSTIKEWQWNFGDGQSLNATKGGEVSHKYNDPGYYFVSLRVTDNSGCTSSTSSYTKAVTINGPKAAFSASGTNVSLNSTVYFYNNTNNYNSYNTTYEWRINDVFFSNFYSPYHTFDVPGTYTVKLIASNPLTNCSSEFSQVIVVNNFNSAFRLNTSVITQNGCPPVLASFTNTSVNYIRVAWDFGDGVKVGNVNYPTHVYEKPGKYIVTLSVFGPNGLTGEYIDSVIVKQPSAAIQADVLEGCIGHTPVISAKATNTSLYLWDFGDGSIVQTSDSFAKHPYTTPGIYSPVLLMRDPSGCLGSAALGDKIKIRPNPAVNISPAQAQVCKGASVALNATGGVTYSWSPATGLNNPLIAAPLASPDANTLYTVRVADDIGCKNTGTITVTVVQPVSLQATSDFEVCEGTPVQLNASGAVLYTWIKTTNGLSDIQIANPIAKPTSTTVYTVTGSDAFKCFTDTAEVTVKVMPLPAVQVGADVEVLAGTPVQLEPTYSSDVVKWTWTPASYLSCADCAAPLSKPLSNTSYVLTVKNSDGCLASDTMNIKMFCEEGHVGVPNAFSPNGDNKNEVFMVKGISIIKHMVIFNRWGQKIFERNNFIASDRSSCWDGTFNNYPASAGTYVYFIEMECPGGGAFSRKGSVVLVR